jgi:hypothetical protein
LRNSVDPAREAFGRLWPEAQLANLLEDSLSADVARDGALTPAMTARFLTLARYMIGCGADGLLFTCSAFGPCIEACARAFPQLPVLKPNDAMIAEAVARAGPTGRIGLLASFPSTLATMPQEFAAVAPGVTVVTALAEDALARLDAGQGEAHDRSAARAAEAAFQDCDVVALAQFSLARAAPSVAAVVPCTVLTTPDSAVAKLRQALGASPIERR